VIRLYVSLCSRGSLLFDATINVLLVLFVFLDLSDAILLGLSLSLGHCVAAVLNDLHFRNVVTLHFAVECVCAIFNRRLEDLEDVLEL
jgi:hypothetical protein